MKNLITNSVLVFTLMGTSLAMASDSDATVENVANEEYRIVKLSDLNKDEAKAFCLAKMEGVILSIEGSTISFSITLDSNLLSDLLDANKHTTRKVKIMKPCFIKCEGGVHSFSSDFRVWKSFKEFFHGEMDVSFHIDEETSLVNINLHVELNQQD